MIKRIELINFMSHRHTVIEPAAGLTVLVGPNNCGKSAIVTALQILCHNDASTYVLRHGAKECQIIVETDDGHLIEWSRKKSGSPSYKINGKEFDRLKGESGVWDELKRTLRLPRVEFENNKFDVHIGEQRNPVFLLDDKGKGAAQFFASSSDAIKLVQMQDLHKANARENKKERGRLAAQQIQVHQALESLDPIAAVNETLIESEKQFSDLQSAEIRCVKHEVLLKDLTQHETDTKRFASIAAVFSELPTPPQFADPLPLQKRVAQLRTLEASIRKSELLHKALQPLAAPPQFADPLPLQKRVAQLRTLENSIRRSKLSQNALQPLASPPTLADTRSLKTMMASIQNQKRSVDQLSKLQAALSAVPKLPTPTDAEAVASIAKIVVSLQIAHESCDQMRKELTAVGEKVSQSKSAIEEWAAENPSCPTCGSEVSAETMLSGGGHQHG